MKYLIELTEEEMSDPDKLRISQIRKAMRKAKPAIEVTNSLSRALETCTEKPSKIYIVEI